MGNVSSRRNGFPWAVVATLLLFMLVPALSFFRIWPLGSAISAGATLFCVGVLFSFTFFARCDNKIRFNFPITLFLAFILSLVVSVAANSFSYEAAWRWYLIAFIVCVLTLMAACELRDRDPDRFLRTLSGLLWLGSAIYGVTSLLKYYGLLGLFYSWSSPSGGRLEGIWGQSNLTTTVCWLGVLSGSVFLSSKPRQFGWWLASILVFGWVLACAASRMSWFMALGLLALVVVSQLPRYRLNETIRASRLLLSGSMLVVVMLLVVPPLNQLVRDDLIGFGLLDQAVSESLADRDVFHDSARLSELSKVVTGAATFGWKQWLLGVGPGNYPAFSYKADMMSPPSGIVPGTWLHSHNIFSMIFVEFGLLGLTILLCFVASIFYVVLRVRIDLPRFFSIGGVGLIFVHSNLEYPLWYFWFLVLVCLLLTNLFEIRRLKGDSILLKPVMGGAGLLMILALLVNVGYQYLQIASVAMTEHRSKEDYERLAFLANDSLMGPYAILRKYRDFSPETTNLDWQLREARRMKAWQPRDLVILREFSVLVLSGRLTEACKAAEQSAYRYPYSAPIMLDHSILAGALSSAQVADIANCIEKGLAPRGESILSVKQKNKLRTENFR